MRSKSMRKEKRKKWIEWNKQVIYLVILSQSMSAAE